MILAYCIPREQVHTQQFETIWHFGLLFISCYPAHSKQEGNGPIDQRALDAMKCDQLITKKQWMRERRRTNTYNSNLNDFLGHRDLKLTSEVTSDLKLKFSDLNTTCNHGPLASRALFLQNLPALHHLLLLKLCPYQPLISEASAKRCPLIKTYLKQN